MSLSVAEEGHEDKSGGGEFSSCRPVHRHRSTLSAKHDPGPSCSWSMLTWFDTYRCAHWNPSWNGSSVTGKVRHMSVRGSLFLTGNLSAARPYSGCMQFFWSQPPFPTPTPHEPHPPPSVLRGLLAAQEAELVVRRTGPGPSVSPRLKGSDYMENWI